MNKKSSLKTSDEIPAITKADTARAKFRINLEEVPKKKRINIMLDVGVLEFYKQKASGRGYQTLINETLKRAINQEDMERTIRRVIREELSQKNR
jgi:uncharacterized protein (DUF4415 family)